MIADDGLMRSGPMEQEGVSTAGRLTYRIDLPGYTFSHVIELKLVYTATLTIR